MLKYQRNGGTATQKIHGNWRFVEPLLSGKRIADAGRSRTSGVSSLLKPSTCNTYKHTLLEHAYGCERHQPAEKKKKKLLKVIKERSNSQTGAVSSIDEGQHIRNRTCLSTTLNFLLFFIHSRAMRNTPTSSTAKHFPKRRLNNPRIPRHPQPSVQNLTFRLPCVVI